MRRESDEENTAPSWVNRLYATFNWLWGVVVFGSLLNFFSSWLTSAHFSLIGTPLGALIEHPNLSIPIILFLLLMYFLLWRVRHSYIHPSLSPYGPAGRLRILKTLRHLYKEKQNLSLNHIDIYLSNGLDPEQSDGSINLNQSSMQVFPAGKTIVNVYDSAGLCLLILGESGAGKSMQLYDLAQTLLDRAEYDEDQALPIVLNLSSWKNPGKETFEDWVCQQLYQQLLGIYPRIWREHWLNNKDSNNKNSLIFFLDGLDEVSHFLRVSCVEAINDYYAEHVVSRVVCSRTRDYQSLLPLMLTSANIAVVQPLALHQVEAYLIQAGTQFAAVLKMVQNNATNQEFQELLKTPLMLTMIMQTYKDKTDSDLQLIGPVNQLRDQIFSKYYENMLYKDKKSDVFSPEKMRLWLVWLAKQMRDHNQKDLYLDQLQPDWLKGGGWEEGLYLLFGVQLPAIVIGMLITILVNVFCNGYTNGWTLLFYGALGAVLGGLLCMKNEAFTVQNPLYNSNRSRLSTVIAAIALASIVGMVAEYIVTQDINSLTFPHLHLFFYVNGVTFGIGTFLLIVLLFMMQPISQKLSNHSANIIKNIKNPWLHQFSWLRQSISNQALRDALKHGLLIGGLLGLSYGFSYGLHFGLAIGLRYTFILGLRYCLSGALISLLLVHKPVTIIPAEILVWSKKGIIRSLFRGEHCIFSSIFSLSMLWIFGMSYLLSYLSDGLSVGLGVGLGFGLGFALSVGGSYWLLVGLFQSISSKVDFKQRKVSDQGIRGSFKNARTLGTIGGFVALVVGGLGIVSSYFMHAFLPTASYGLPVGFHFLPNFLQSFNLSFGLSDGLGNQQSLNLIYEVILAIILFLTAYILAFILMGGLAWWRHYVLRYCFYRSGALAWRTERMLDEAAQHILLHKSKGSYSFFHDSFRDYLANL